MARLFILSILLSLLGAFAKAEDITSHTLYLQLIHGSDSPAPPEPEAKFIGPRLSERLHPIFRWKNYWEVKRDSVSLNLGEKVRRPLSPDREVEITLLDSKNIQIRVYSEGKSVSDQRQSLENLFFISGGDKGSDQAWFVVVRHCPPQNY